MVNDTRVFSGAKSYVSACLPCHLLYSVHHRNYESVTDIVQSTNARGQDPTRENKNVNKHGDYESNTHL